ncbi:NAD-binding protein [Anaerobacillus sp. HL2]|nr:NAD-binding protein [Anaerobacillus sp. HL2]
MGWNERSKNVILQTQKANPRQEIVLIDSTLRQCPLKTELVHFIRGNPIEDNTLKRANIEFAHNVVITTDFHILESEADSKSIVTLLAIKGLNPNIYSVVENFNTKTKITVFVQVQ